MLVYDADRSGCRALARHAAELLPLGIPVVPWQRLPSLGVPDLGVLGLDEDACRRSPWWIGVDGVPVAGSRAVVGVIVAARRWWSPFAVLLTAPGAGMLTMLALRLVGAVLERRDPTSADSPPMVAPADGSIGTAPDTTATATATPR